MTLTTGDSPLVIETFEKEGADLSFCPWVVSYAPIVGREASRAVPLISVVIPVTGMPLYLAGVDPAKVKLEALVKMGSAFPLPPSSPMTGAAGLMDAANACSEARSPALPYPTKLLVNVPSMYSRLLEEEEIVPKLT